MTFDAKADVADQATLPAQPESAPRWRWISLGLGTAMCATLLFEIVLMRIFSVILWYHYGFVCISLALLGIGWSGILVYLYPERFTRARVPRHAALAALAFAIAIVVALLLFHGLVTFRTSWPLATSELLLVFLIMTGPFFFAGLCAALPLSRYTDRVGLLYAADLTGAAVGAALVIPLLSLLDGHRTLVVCACLAAAAAIFFAKGAANRRILIGGVIALVGCLVALGVTTQRETFKIRFSKFGREKDVVYEKWNSFSRVTVREKGMVRAGWNLSRNAPAGGARTWGIKIDGGAGTPMLEFAGDFERLRFLGYDISALGYKVRPTNSACIIGSGGGRDILAARVMGVEQIHAVEINPIIVDVVRNVFRSYSGSPYDLPGVTFSIVDGRSFMSTSKEKFDHVQLSAVDTIAASAAGALALVEQSLYTVEAFLEYHDHLAENGLLSMTRPFSDKSQLNCTLRTVELVRAAWLRRGHPEPQQHVIVIGFREPSNRPRWGTLLASRQPFTSDEVTATVDLCADLGFEILYAPGYRDNVDEVEALFSDSREDFLREWPANVLATTDDRPYFFYFHRPFTTLFGDERVSAAPTTSAPAEQTVKKPRRRKKGGGADASQDTPRVRKSGQRSRQAGDRPRARRATSRPTPAKSDAAQARGPGGRIKAAGGPSGRARKKGQRSEESGDPPPRVHVTPTILTKLFVGVLALTALTAFIVPLALGRLRLVAAKGAGTGLVYFAGIGLGFIMVELAMLQRYTLLLGHPVYAFSVILGTVLVASGIGSFLSHRVRQDQTRSLARLILILVVAGTIVHAFFMPRLLDVGMHWGLGLRFALTIVTIAPLALAMGFAFPLGMRLLERRAPAALPWAWCVNGSLSVLGTVIAMILSIFFGISITMYAAAAAYFVSALIPWRVAGRSTQPVSV